ncbi:restriction endonuclease subunit S [Paraburkholderia sediminicola]|nr:restriction endonuclease subunit S [Paraburkholderia sediminicola]
MSSEFAPTKLGTLIDFANGRTSPERSEKGRWPVYGSNGPIGAADETNSKEETIVIGRVGSYCGSVYFSPTRCWVTDNAIRGTAKGDNSPSFLFYLLKHLNLNNWRSGSGQPLINQATLNAIDVHIPKSHDQREIGRFLSCIDARITLLRETNVTLETIAQTLFKSWFVDFEPVRARQEGRVHEGMGETTAALFPTEFEESELGLVPRGWRIGKLEDLLLLQRGFDLPAANRTAGDFPIIAASGPSGTHKVPMAKAPGVVTGRSGVLGRVFLELEDYWPLNTTLWVKDFRAATPSYAYEVLRRLDFASYNAGSAVPTLNRNHIHSLPYLIPSRACIDAFEALAMPLYRRVRENQKQANSLAEVRDALLPRLISGQLRLPEAEALVA